MPSQIPSFTKNIFLASLLIDFILYNQQLVHTAKKKKTLAWSA